MKTAAKSRREKRGGVGAKGTSKPESDTPQNGNGHATGEELVPDAALALTTEASLSAAELDQFVSHLIRGASPAGACMQLGHSIRSLLRKLAEDADFRQRVDDVQWVLRENVKSALYREAMGGNVSAQRCFLQLVGVGDMTPFRQGFDDDDENWESMTPHDMAEKYRTAGVVVPEELEALL